MTENRLDTQLSGRRKSSTPPHLRKSVKADWNIPHIT